ncbi:MAG: hypothetical protein ACKPKO_34480, partial [Candidatus Fonsibacter sp.]
ELADWHFIKMVEGELLYNIEQYGINMYVRYRDDFFIIASDVGGWQRFFVKMRALAGNIWELNLEDVSTTLLNYLDIIIYKGERFCSSGILDYKPHFKVSSQRDILSPESGHAPTVHRAWPAAEVARMARRASCMTSFINSRDKIIKEFTINGMDNKVINAALMVQYEPREHATRAARNKIWLRLPFHPILWRAGMQKMIDDIWSEWSKHVKDAIKCDRIGIAWSNGDEHFIHTIRRI